MGVLAKCPSCGMPSDAVRCPRCNALKVTGCSGSCTLCKEHCEGDEPTATRAGAVNGTSAADSDS